MMDILFAALYSQETLTQCWHDVGPASKTMGQHRSNTGWMPRVFLELLVILATVITPGQAQERWPRPAYMHKVCPGQGHGGKFRKEGGTEHTRVVSKHHSQPSSQPVILPGSLPLVGWSCYRRRLKLYCPLWPTSTTPCRGMHDHIVPVPYLIGEITRVVSSFQYL